MKAAAIFAFALAAMVPSLCCAQMDMSSQGASMTMKEIPPRRSFLPPVRMTGIGNSHIAINSTPEAQMWFDQGLNLLHDFWEYESARAFEQSVRVDPSCAMCYWGLHQALIFRHSGSTAYSGAALDNAVRLRGKADEMGKFYIDAAVAASDARKAPTPGSGSAAEEDKEISILRQLVKKYPADTEANIFLAVSLQDGYDDAGEPKKGTKEAITILTQVLKTAPTIPPPITTGYTLSKQATNPNRH